MSRRKHQAAKTLAGKTPNEKLRISQYGAGYDERVFSFVDQWNDLFTLHPFLGESDAERLEKFSLRDWLKASSEQQRKTAPWDLRYNVDLLLGKLRQAIETGDGRFFAALAHAVDRYKNQPVDRLRFWLVKKFYFESDESHPSAKPAREFEDVRIERRPVRVPDLLLEAEDEGLHISDRQMRRALTELRIPYEKGKAGRPKGKD